MLAPELAFGLPHVYRVGLRIGLLDHLTLGATIHWLPGEATPAWSPLVGVAFYRGRVLYVGKARNLKARGTAGDDGSGSLGLNYEYEY